MLTKWSYRLTSMLVQGPRLWTSTPVVMVSLFTVSCACPSTIVELWLYCWTAAPVQSRVRPWRLFAAPDVNTKCHRKGVFADTVRLDASARDDVHHRC